MVKVTFRPWEEIVIHEETYYSHDDLIKLSSIGIQPGGLTLPLSWAEGVIFRAQAMPTTDEVIKEQLQGKIHWTSIQWALMPEYKNVILIQDINAKIPIINVSANSIFSEVVRALKEKAGQ